MKRYIRSRYLAAVAACGLLALAPRAARAEAPRKGDEPWYQQAVPDLWGAKALFAQAVDKHLQLLRGDARDLYSEALALWDNPDIRWNLALVLEDLGQYLLAYQQLDHALRWGDALGAERLRSVRDRMQALQIQRLALIEPTSDEAGAELTLDGQPWSRDAGQRSRLVEPGDHYVAAHKAGFFPVTRAISVKAGQSARVALPMDEDRLLETRRWSEWKPWVVVSAGAVVTAVGAGLQYQANRHRDTAKEMLPGVCTLAVGCPPTRAPPGYDRAVVESRIALGAFIAGGTTLAVGLTMVWLNKLHVRRTEARVLGPIEVIPISPAGQAGVSARLRF